MNARINNKNYEKLLKAPYQLIGIMVSMVILIIGMSIYGLYNVGCEQQKQRLIEIVQNQSVMIGEIVKHHSDHEYKNMNQVVEKNLIDTMEHAHEHFEGFGETGEFTLAKLDGENIVFLHHNRHSVDDSTEVVPFLSTLAEPMRRALNGETGNMLGLDYLGNEVLAAYSPVHDTGLGVVAKIDMSEIRSPYIDATMYGLFGGLVLVVIGSIFVLNFTEPLIKELEQNREYNRLLFEKSPIGLALTDMNGNMVDVNKTYANLIGRGVEDTLSLSYWDITPKKYADKEKNILKELHEKKSYGPYEKEYIHNDGNLVNVRLNGRIVKRDGESYIWSSVEDITKSKQDEMELKEASLVFENTHEGILITDNKLKIIKTNMSVSDITGYTMAELRGKEPSMLQSGSHDLTFYKKMWLKITKDGYWYGELNNRRKNGEFYTTLQSITSIVDENGDVIRYISVFTDITERKNNEMRLAYLASHDTLTSLPNRMHFYDNLNKAIHSAKRNKHKLAVLFLDLNDFKIVNDTFGHEAGDMLLKEIAIRLKECTREEDTVSRLGGDEFAVVLEELKDSEDAVLITKKIIDKVSEKFSIQNSVLIPSVSIGISMYPEHGDDVDTLLNLADKAMYVSKVNKANKEKQYEVYSLV